MLLFNSKRGQMYIITAIIIIILFFSLVYTYRNRSIIKSDDYESIANQYVHEMKNAYNFIVDNDTDLDYYLEDFHRRYFDLLRLRGITIDSLLIVEDNDELVIADYFRSDIEFSCAENSPELFSFSDLNNYDLSDIFFMNDSNTYRQLPSQELLFLLPNEGSGSPLEYRINLPANRSNYFLAIVALQGRGQKSIFLI